MIICLSIFEALVIPLIITLNTRDSKYEMIPIFKFRVMDTAKNMNKLISLIIYLL